MEERVLNSKQGPGLELGLVEIFLVSVQLNVLCLVKEHCDNDMAGGMTWHDVIMIWQVA